MTLVDLIIEVFVSVRSVRVGEATGQCQRESASGRSSWRMSKGHVRHVVHRNSGHLYPIQYARFTIRNDMH